MSDTHLASKYFPSKLVVLGILGLLVTTTRTAQTQTESVLYSFCSQADCADGYHPNDALIMDAQGNLYGTTLAGGVNNGCIGGCGTVFKLSPAGVETVLHSFGDNPTDGQNPISALIMDQQGNLYGTTYMGGAYRVGTVFEISTAGIETILHSFKKGSKDGNDPCAGLIMDTNGNLYGTTVKGGTHGVGTVFEISPNGTETILHSFAGHRQDGAHPYGALIMDAQGNLYGTTSAGGAYGSCSGIGCGTVFEIIPGPTETILHSFSKKLGDGYHPTDALIMDANGNFYGTTYFGGAHFYGTVFELTPAGAETVLYSFCSQGGPNCTDGANPVGPLVMDTQRNLYGATVLYAGTVFKLSPNGTETLLHSFLGAPDGEVPFSGLVMGADGNLYGTTAFGGTSDSTCTLGYQGCGTVFQVTP